MRNIVILISGKMGSGKSTLQKRIVKELNETKLYKAAAFNFADPLYEMQDLLVNHLRKYIQVESRKYGKLLQYLGTEFGRGEIDPEIWVKIASSKCDGFFSEMSNTLMQNRVAVFGDTRFKNELEMSKHFFRPYEVLRIRLEAPRDMRKERCQGWRDTENHLSETDLDTELHRFDLVLDTSQDRDETWQLTRTYLFGRGIIFTEKA